MPATTTKAAAGKLYVGLRGCCLVPTVTVNGRLLDPAPSLKLRNHSPDGWEWGYNGSGPAQLALGILLEHTCDAEVAQQHYQDFKDAFITRAHREAFEISGEQIDAWLKTKRR